MSLITLWILTEGAGQLDAGRCREEPIPSLPSTHARPFEQVIGVVVVEGVLAGGVRTVDGHALEAVDAFA